MRWTREKKTKTFTQDVFWTNFASWKGIACYGSKHHAQIVALPRSIQIPTLRRSTHSIEPLLTLVRFGKDLSENKIKQTSTKRSEIYGNVELQLASHTASQTAPRLAARWTRSWVNSWSRGSGQLQLREILMACAASNLCRLKSSHCAFAQVWNYQEVPGSEIGAK